MRVIAKQCVLLTVAVFLTAALVFPAAAAVELSDVSWRTVGTSVEFHVQFYNPDPVNPSGTVSGELNTQPFGAFVPDNGTIGTFDIPPIPPESFFDVFYDVPLSSLPPSAEKITPGGGSNGGGVFGLPPADCPPDLRWAGNVDVIWSGPGGSGTANYHFGTIQVDPGGQPSYIHMLSDCTDPAGMSWSFSNLCPGWSATLVLDDGTLNPDGPAPNPIPPGAFDGWICVTADSTISPGDSCCFDLDLNCGSQPATIHVCADACISSPVSTEKSSWGRVKSIYKKQD